MCSCSNKADVEKEKVLINRLSSILEKKKNTEVNILLLVFAKRLLYLMNMKINEIVNESNNDDEIVGNINTEGSINQGLCNKMNSQFNYEQYDYLNENEKEENYNFTTGFNNNNENKDFLYKVKNDFDLNIPFNDKKKASTNQFNNNKDSLILNKIKKEIGELDELNMRSKVKIQDWKRKNEELDKDSKANIQKMKNKKIYINEIGSDVESKVQFNQSDTKKEYSSLSELDTNKANNQSDYDSFSRKDKNENNKLKSFISLAYDIKFRHEGEIKNNKNSRLSDLFIKAENEGVDCSSWVDFIKNEFGI